MMYQNEMNALDWTNVFNPFLNIFILVFFIALMLIVYSVKKFRIFVVILTLFLFSIVIGILSISINETPFTPYLQIFFMVFQAIIFIKFTLEAYA